MKYFNMKAKNKTTKQKLVVVLLTGMMLSVSSCGLYQYNNSDPAKLPDHHENDPYVYGDKGDSARQLRNVYTDTPESQARANAIRDKFFVVDKAGDGSNLQETTVAPANAPATTADDKKDKKTVLVVEEKKK